MMSVKLKYLCLAHRKHPDQAHLSAPDCRKEEIKTSPPEADQNQEMFDIIPSPFSIKVLNSVLFIHSV